MASTRIHGTTRQQVRGHFETVERRQLRALPAGLFPCFQEATRRVHRDGYVEVAKAYYSVPGSVRSSLPRVPSWPPGSTCRKTGPARQTFSAIPPDGRTWPASPRQSAVPTPPGSSFPSAASGPKAAAGIGHCSRSGSTALPVAGGASRSTGPAPRTSRPPRRTPAPPAGDRLGPAPPTAGSLLRARGTPDRGSAPARRAVPPALHALR